MRMELLTHNKPSSPDPLHQEVTFKRPLSYTKMENLIKEMQDPELGVPVRSQKILLRSIPAAFAGYDLIEWLMERLSIDESGEAIQLANMLCQHGYFFPVGDNRMFTVKDDSSLYRFQTPYYWPSQYPLMDSVDYAIYLAKRSLRNKQKHGLDDYEIDALAQLRRNLNQKWDFISMQADEQVKISKERKKVDKLVTDAQERAFWRVLRPPPGSSCCVETPPMYNHDFHQKEGVKQIRRTNLIEDLRAEVDLLRTSCIRTRIKVSQALESLANRCEGYIEHDPFLIPRQPSNPWISDDPCYWIINAPLIEIPTERRVKKWSISMEDLVLDPTGLREITAYLKKEYCHENIRFWLAVRDLRYGPVSQLRSKAQQLYNEFLSPGAPCEINIDMRTMEAVQKELNYLAPSRFTFDPAAEHVYTLLLKKDCYPRFIRSEQYKTLLANALQPINQKKRLDKFLSYLALGKKKSSTATPPIYPVGGVLTIPPANMGLGEMFKAADEAIMMATGNKSDLLSASSLDTDKLSVSVLADCPYRGDLATDDRRDIDSVRNTLSQGSFDDVCPWESMEKLPDKDKEKAPSLSQSVASSSISGSKPPVPVVAGTSASVPSSSEPVKVLAGNNSTNLSSLSGPVSGSSTVTASASIKISPPMIPVVIKQEPVLSKQSSVTSMSSSGVTAHHQPPPAAAQPPHGSPCSLSSSSATDNQLGSKPSPPQQQVSQISTLSSGSGGGETSSTTSASRESVIQASPTMANDKGFAPLASSDEIESESQTQSFTHPPPHPKTSSSAMLPPLPCQSLEEEALPPYQMSTSPPNPSTSSGSYYPQSSEGEDDIKPSTSNNNNMGNGHPKAPPHHLVDNNRQGRGEDGTETEICPWDHENGTRPESITFVKTYSTLGYL